MSGTVAAFLGDKLLVRGARDEVTRFIEDRYSIADHAAIRTFDEETGRVTDLDYWDASRNAAARPPQADGRARGRPKLGVVSREVTLLPRHWEWLGRQPGGASAAIRRLVDEARKAGPRAADARDAAYRFMTELAGDRPGYEEALRALYGGDFDTVRAIAGQWPVDVRTYLDGLLAAAAR